MLNYYKTELGLEALQQRSRDLNARQRRLLVVIGTEAFNLLSHSHKERIAPPELLEQLQDMGLIAPANRSKAARANPLPVSEIQVSNTTLEHSPPAPTSPAGFQPIQTSLVTATHHKAVEPVLEAMSFEEVKQLMAQLLSQYCGLMAKQLMVQIQTAQDIRSLKLCQMQWITNLQESRISPQQLNHALQQVNHSLQELHHYS